MFYYAFLWITTSIRDQESSLGAALLEQGFDVGPASSQRSFVTGDESSESVILGYRIGWLEVKTMDEVWQQIFQAFEKSKIKYHSVILAESTDSRWCASNIKPKSKTNLN